MDVSIKNSGWPHSNRDADILVAGVQYHGCVYMVQGVCPVLPPAWGVVHRMHQAAPSPLLPFSGTLGKRFMLTYHHSECSATAYRFIRVEVRGIWAAHGAVGGGEQGEKWGTKTKWRQAQKKVRHVYF